MLVTGATGNVGRAVVDALLAAGEPVRATVRPSSSTAASAAWPPEVHRATFDWQDPATWDAAFVGARSVLVVRPRS